MTVHEHFEEIFHQKAPKDGRSLSVLNSDRKSNILSPLLHHPRYAVILINAFFELQRESFMKKIMERPRWSIILRGIIAIFLGIFALFYPGMTLAILIALFGIYVFANGLLAVIFAAYDRKYSDEHWWLYGLEGIIGLIVGILVFSWPALTSIILVYIISAWAIVTGVIQIFAYIRLQQVFESEVLLLLSGLFSIVIGIILLRFPIGGLMTVTWVVGLYVFLYGSLLITSAFRAEKHSG